MKYYRTILIDPPWPVKTVHVTGKWKGGIEDKYPTMTVEQISKMPIGNIAAENSNLFMWVTHNFLEDGLKIMKDWGFKYHIVITWNKGSGWTMFGFHRMTELCLYGYRGKMTIPDNGKSINCMIDSIPDLFDEKKTVHSRKPLKFYRILEAKTPEPRLEIFARNKRAGWDVFGNEVESDIQLIGM